MTKESLLNRKAQLEREADQILLQYRGALAEIEFQLKQFEDADKKEQPKRGKPDKS